MSRVIAHSDVSWVLGGQWTCASDVNKPDCLSVVYLLCVMYIEFKKRGMHKIHEDSPPEFVSSDHNDLVNEIIL